MQQNESSAIFLRMNLYVYLFLILNCKNLVHEYKILPLKNLDLPFPSQNYTVTKWFLTLPMWWEDEIWSSLEHNCYTQIYQTSLRHTSDLCRGLEEREGDDDTRGLRIIEIVSLWSDYDQSGLRPSHQHFLRTIIKYSCKKGRKRTLGVFLYAALYFISNIWINTN